MIHLEKLVTYDAGTRDIVIYRDPNPRIFGWLQILLKPWKYPKLRPRPFTMPCRPVCGMDLKRLRFTCLFVCKIRKIYTGQMAPVNELADIYTLMIMKRRRHEWLKAFVLRKLLPICEWAASY
jgi:hypothetical protein